MKHIFLILLVITITSCTAAPAQPATVQQPTDTPQANMPNPASAYCEEQGYTLEIRTAEDGSQAGYCIFPDGGECDEWAFYRGECEPAPQVTDTAVPTEADISASPTETTTPEATPTELAADESSPYEGWLEYVEPNYGFKFYYPPDWTAEVDLRADSTTYQHFLWLRAPDKPVPGVEMHIAFESLDENYGLQRTGIGAGDLVERGNVLFLGEDTPRIVLTLEGVDMEVMYGNTGPVERGDMRFALSLYYAGMERLGLSEDVQAIADQVVESFEWIK